MFYRRFSAVGFSVAFLNRRAHHPDITMGIWKTAINARQLFIGRFGMVFSWPYTKIGATGTMEIHEHAWKDYEYGEASIDYVLTAQHCDCGAVRDYKGPAYGWVMVKEGSKECK